MHSAPWSFATRPVFSTSRTRSSGTARMPWTSRRKPSPRRLPRCRVSRARPVSPPGSTGSSSTWPSTVSAAGGEWSLAGNLQKTFRYSRYQLLDAPQASATLNQTWRTGLPDNRALEITPTAIQDGQYNLTVRVLGAGGQPVREHRGTPAPRRHRLGRRAFPPAGRSDHRNLGQLIRGPGRHPSVFAGFFGSVTWPFAPGIPLRPQKIVAIHTRIV